MLLASRRQPSASTRQCARACRRAKVATDATGVPPADAGANGAPRRRTSSRSPSTLIEAMRCRRRLAQASARPRPSTMVTPFTCNSDDHEDRSASFADAYSRPLPLARSKSSTKSTGEPSRRLRARSPLRTRSPSTCRRRSTSGITVSIFSDGAEMPSRASITCSSPRPSSARSGSPPWACPGNPRTCQRPSSARSSVSARLRTRSSVKERPGNRPAYCETRISAAPMATASLPAPTRKPSSRSSGPRLVHSVSRVSNCTGRPARALSHSAMRSGCRSASGSS